LDRGFAGLYESGDDEGGDDRGTSAFGAVAFMRIYGWHYTVKLIAEHENIRNSEAFEMKTIEALNVMAYLKSKNAYDLEQTKRLR
jgi:hypothetical protein